MTQYYYYAPERLGPVDAATIRKLANEGIIVPKTVVEIDDGRRCFAEKIQGLVFIKTEPENLSPPSLPIEKDEVNGNVQSQAIETSDSGDESAVSETTILIALGCVAFFIILIICAASTNSLSYPLSLYVTIGIMVTSINLGITIFIIWAICKHLSNQRKMLEQQKNLLLQLNQFYAVYEKSLCNDK